MIDREGKHIAPPQHPKPETAQRAVQEHGALMNDADKGARVRVAKVTPWKVTEPGLEPRSA